MFLNHEVNSVNTFSHVKIISVSFIYFVGRNFRGKKILRGKSRNFRNFFFRNNIIFHNSQLFLPQQYNFSQFASFLPATYTLRVRAYFFSFILTDTHARHYQILLIFLTLIVVWGLVSIWRDQTDPIFVGCSNSTLSIFPHRLSNIWKKKFRSHSFIPPPFRPSLLSIWVYSQPSPLRV